MLPVPRSPDGRTVRDDQSDSRQAWGTAGIMPVTNAIERLHEEFKRRIKTQCLLPCAETAAMLFWALLTSGQITMRRVDGWPTLERSPKTFTSPPETPHHAMSAPGPPKFPLTPRHDPDEFLPGQCVSDHG
jgi:hypothetical protein